MKTARKLGTLILAASLFLGSSAAAQTILAPLRTFNGSVGDGSVLTPGNASDGNQATFASLSVTGNRAINTASYQAIGFQGSGGTYATLTLKILLSIPQNSLNGTGQALMLSWDVNDSNPGAVVFTANAGQAVALQTVTVPLAVNTDLKNLIVTAIEQSGQLQTSGSATVQIYEVWVEAT